MTIPLRFSIKKLNGNLDQHEPFKKLSIQEEKLSKKPWITAGVLNSNKNKNRLYRKVIREKDPERITNLCNKFKLYRNKLDKILKASKSMHHQKYFETNKVNLRKTWDGIREVINIRIKKGQTINTLNSDNGIINEDMKISEQFKKHFYNIAKTIEKEIPSAKNNFSVYLKNPIEKSFFINPTTADKVETQIKCLKNNKASGPKSIPTSIFKNVRKSLSVPLAEIINLSFNEGKFPTQLKSANLIPVFKKGDKLEVNNYRQISLISNISKAIEKLIHRRLNSFLEQNNIFYPSQFGFRDRHSTSHAFIEITDKTMKACDQGIFACGVYLDLKKASDTVNHNILLSKLHHYGTRAKANDWFKLFLVNRTEYTSIKDANSTSEKVMYGVSQGSVLGPLLFIIFINDFY